MKKVIRNNTGIQFTFTDEGVLCEAPERGLFFPYGSISKIKHGFLGLEIEGCGKSFFMATTGKMKADCKEMVAYTQSAMKTAPFAVVVDCTEQTKAKRKAEEEALMRVLLGDDYDGLYDEDAEMDEDLKELLRMERELAGEEDSSGLHYI